MNLSRRLFIPLAASGLGSLCQAQLGSRPAASAVLKSLLAGNDRFVHGKLSHPGQDPKSFIPLAAGQSPKAIIVGCSDSRVPPEILFDQGVGDLFVIRVAGNVIKGAGSAVKGSIAYGVLELKAPLIMVLGHSGCGAVKAAMSGTAEPQPIKDLVALVQKGGETTLEGAVAANVRTGVSELNQLMASILPHGASAPKITGGVYDLASGRVKLIS